MDNWIVPTSEQYEVEFSYKIWKWLDHVGIRRGVDMLESQLDPRVWLLPTGATC